MDLAAALSYTRITLFASFLPHPCVFNLPGYMWYSLQHKGTECSCGPKARLVASKPKDSPLHLPQHSNHWCGQRWLFPRVLAI